MAFKPKRVPFLLQLLKNKTTTQLKITESCAVKAERIRHTRQTDEVKIVKLLTIAFILVCYPFHQAVAAKYALLVGIADYKSLPAKAKDGKSDLRGPLNDVRMISEVLTDRYGFPNQNITILTDENATRQKIVDAFHRQLINQSQPGDTVVFYFSGHGSQVTDNNGDEPPDGDGLDEVLCPYDIEFKGGKNLILDDELGNWLRAVADRNVVVIIDSCHSGGGFRLPNTLQERFIPITDYRPNPAAFNRSRGADVPDQVVALTASKEHQRSYEVRFDSGFFGVFSYGLHDAMRKKQLCSYEVLFRHAEGVVEKELAKMKVHQKPQLFANPHRKAAIAFDQSPADLDQNKKISLNDFLKGFDQRVFVAAKTLSNATSKKTRKLRRKLSNMPDVEVVKDHEYWDILLEVDKTHGVYHAEISNKMGQKETIDAVGDLAPIIKALQSQVKKIRTIKALVKLRQANPPFTIKLATRTENKRYFKTGEYLEFTIESEKDCHILMLSANQKGAFQILIPNPVEGGFISAASKVLVPTDKMKAKKLTFKVTPPLGEEIVKVLASSQKLELNKIGNQITQTERKAFTNQLLDKLNAEGIDWSETSVLIHTYQ